MTRNPSKGEAMPETEEIETTEAMAAEPADPEPVRDDDDEAADDDEQDAPEPEPEPAASVSPEVLDARRTKGEKAAAAYTKKIQAIYEEEEDNLFPCPLCPDAHRGFLNIHDAGRFPEEVVKVVQQFLGITQEADYVADTTFATCDRCAGLGKVKTGSRVPQWLTMTCEACSGRGYIAPAGHVPAVNGASGYAQDAPDGYSSPAAQEEADAWGSPRLLPNGTENPNYGKMPQYKSAQWP